MEQPVPSVEREPRFPLPDPIGEVHVLVYGWERGKTEVRVKFPAEAASGNSTQRQSRPSSGASSSPRSTTA
jgi:hypothetical protein